MMGLEVKSDSNTKEKGSDVDDLAAKIDGTVLGSVSDLLECPVCLNGMYPPIHQVRPHCFFSLIYVLCKYAYIFFL